MRIVALLFGHGKAPESKGFLIGSLAVLLTPLLLVQLAHLF